MIGTCPSCKRQLQVPEDALGKQVCCGACQAIFVIEEEVPVTVVDGPLPVSIIPPAPLRVEPVAPPPEPPTVLESYLFKHAQQAARGASVWVSVVAFLAVLRLLIDLFALGFRGFGGFGQPEMHLVMTVPACVYMVLLVPLLAFASLAIYALRTSGSRLLMLAGAGASFVIGAYGCYGSFPAYRFVLWLNDANVNEETHAYSFGILLFVWVFLIGLGAAGLAASIATVSAVLKLTQANAWGESR